jgi:hypothetical protein
MNFGGQNPQFNQQYLGALMKLMQNPETKDLIGDPNFYAKSSTNYAKSSSSSNCHSTRSQI